MTFSNQRFFQALLALLLIAVTPVLGQNLITNGNFEAGNTGFQTDYHYYTSPDFPLADPGVYHVAKNPHTYHPSGFYSFFDHTYGDGNHKYFFANGYGSSSTAKVWSQTVTVQAHSYYDFTFWGTHLSNGYNISTNRVNFYVKINGTQVGSNFAPQFVSNQGFWDQFPTYRWYSGNQTQATITIYDGCTAGSGWGDDFGIDDISFTYIYTNVVQAVDDNVTTCFEQSVTFDPFANDVVSPSSIRPLVDCSIESLPSHGSLDWYYGTTWIYTPNTGYSGTDQLTYKLTYGTNDIVEYGTVYFTVNARPQRTINVDACESYTWSYTGQTYSQSGQYDFVKPGPNGCDTLLILNLTIHHNEQQTLPPIVECDEYTWHGTTYTQSGTYEYVTTTQWGCQLTQYLPLTINHSDTLDIPVSACEQYTWYGQTYSNSGTYTHMTTNSFGCQRMERLLLTISDRFRHVDNLTECDSYYWPRTQQWYYQSTIDSTTVEGPPGGCDSTFVLNLTLHYADTLDVPPVEACDSYEWHGQTYTTSGIKTYQTTNEFGCDRLERLNLTIHNSESVNLPAVIVCDSYTWHGITYTQSGLVTFDTVNQYGCNLQYTLPLTINHSDTLDWDPVTECDSYLWYGQTITESGNYTHMSTNPEGCDRLERIYVTINYSTIDTLEPVTACDSYDWHGATYTRSGTYTFEGEGPTGCPHTEVLRLTINHSTQYEFNMTSCEPYEWFGTIYDQPGTYYHELTNSQGCDSLLIMNLEIGSIYTMEEDVVGCDSYEWYGDVYTQGGDYQHEVENPNGCDSLFIIHLTIAPTYEEEFEDASCYAYNWIDDTYTQSGDYERHFSSNMGCDSLVTLHLTILEAVYHEFEQQTCGEFPWNGITYYEEGDYEQTFTAANGCDSIVTMHLVFREALTSEFYHQSCTQMQWYENICDHNADYQHTFQSVQGCDSIVTMHFTLTPEIVMPTVDVTACEPFQWLDGQTITENGFWSYTYHDGCDSTVSINVTFTQAEILSEYVSACNEYPFQGQTYPVGTYQIYYDTAYYENGCDSIVHCLNLTVTEAEQLGTINGSHEVYVSSNLFSGIYRYDIDTEGIVGPVEWSLNNIDWLVVEEATGYCRILVPTPGYATLTARFETANCGIMERHFEIHAGFFGVDENGMEVNVYPNPTKSSVTIEAEGILSVRLVNMMGQILDWVETDRADHVILNMNNFQPSIYLLEIDTVYGLVKRRVVLCK